MGQDHAGCPVFPKGVQTYRPSQLPDNSGWRPILIMPQAAIAAAQARGLYPLTGGRYCDH